MSDPYKRWCFTLNNPNNNVDYFNVIKSSSNINRFVYGKEVGDQGTPHLQGYIEFTKARRITSLKVMFPTAHWESAKGNWRKNWVYCTKEGMSSQYGNWSGANNANTKADNKKALIKRLIEGDEEALYLNEYINHKRSIDEVIRKVNYNFQLNKRVCKMYDMPLRGWQIDIFKRLMAQNDRKVMWVYDATGGKGKSWLAMYLMVIYNYDLLNGTTATKDVVGLLSDPPLGICFDVTRGDASHFSYQTLEHSKNAYMITGKYAGIKTLWEICPVIVFANFAPNRSELSEDRWDIHSLEDGLYPPFQETTWDPKTDYPPPCKKKVTQTGTQRT